MQVLAGEMESDVVCLFWLSSPQEAPSLGTERQGCRRTWKSERLDMKKERVSDQCESVSPGSEAKAVKVTQSELGECSHNICHLK